MRWSAPSSICAEVAAERKKSSPVIRQRLSVTLILSFSLKARAAGETERKSQDSVRELAPRSASFGSSPPSPHRFSPRSVGRGAALTPPLPAYGPDTQAVITIMIQINSWVLLLLLDDMQTGLCLRKRGGGADPTEKDKTLQETGE